MKRKKTDNTNAARQARFRANGQRARQEIAPLRTYSAELTASYEDVAEMLGYLRDVLDYDRSVYDINAGIQRYEAAHPLTPRPKMLN